MKKFDRFFIPTGIGLILFGFVTGGYASYLAWFDGDPTNTRQAAVLFACAAAMCGGGAAAVGGGSLLRGRQ